MVHTFNSHLEVNNIGNRSCVLITTALSGSPIAVSFQLSTVLVTSARNRLDNLAMYV